MKFKDILGYISDEELGFLSAETNVNEGGAGSVILR